MGRRKKKQKQNKTHTQKKGSDIRGRARSSRGPRYKEKQTRIQKERPHYLDQESNHSPQKQTNINWTNRVTSPRARSSLRTKQEEEKRENTHTHKKRKKNTQRGENATTNKHPNNSLTIENPPRRTCDRSPLLSFTRCLRRWQAGRRSRSTCVVPLFVCA